MNAPLRAGGVTPSLSRREVGAASLAGVALSVATHWPVVRHIDRLVPQETSDSLLQSWQVAWDGHALAHQPLQLFQSNTFWPLPDSLAFSDALVGYAPAGLIGHGPTAALVRYNLLFLFAYVLAFVGMYLLARELGVRPLVAGIVGIAFAYAPWRLAQNGHLHVLSSGGIPLCLFLLVRGYTRGKPRCVLAGWLVAAWQVSLGFALGLQLGYLLGVLALVFLVGWLRRGRPALPRDLVVATVAGVIFFIGVSGLMARPYLRVVDAHPEGRRTYDEVGYYSPPLSAVLVAPEESTLWGERSRDDRAELSAATEQAILPGYTLLALAAFGLVAGTGSRRLRLGVATGSVVALVLALGTRSPAHGRFAYRLLFDYGPGWQGVRTPGRIITLVTLGLCVLAAFGAERLAQKVVRTGRRWAPAALCLLLAAACLVEGLGRTPYPVAPMPPPGLAAIPGPRLHLPSHFTLDARYMFFSTDGLPRILNGNSGFTPVSQRDTRVAVAGFPDALSVDHLRRMGVRWVVLHRDLEVGTPWERAWSRDVTGLGIRRTTNGLLVFFEIMPAT